MRLGPVEYQCAVCKGWQPVPGLARDCEARHARDYGVGVEDLLTSLTRTP